MKLKTFKDIKRRGNLGRYVERDDVREAAIKWVKEEIKGYGGIYDETRRWMERFNITEEDLK